MKSGDPKSNDDLRLVMATKRGGMSPTIEIVSEASKWMKAALKGADVPYSYAACEEQHYGFAVFTLIRSYRKSMICLELKIAEIGSCPYVFAEVRSLGKVEGKLFPFFGPIHSQEDRDILLHYVSDYLLGTEDIEKSST